VRGKKIINIFFILAVRHAMYHDGSSGGVVRIGIITEDGIERQLFFNTESGEPVKLGN